MAQRTWKTWAQQAALGLMVTLAFAAPGQAAERIVLTYRSLSLPISIPELEAVAQGQEASADLMQLLTLANQTPEGLRQALMSPMAINPTLVSIGLHTPVGEQFLDRLGEAIQPAPGLEGRSALRATLLTAAADGEITLLEVLRLYPSSDIIVQGDHLVAAYSRLIDAIAPWLRILTIGQ